MDARDFVSSPLGPAARTEEYHSPAGKNTTSDTFEQYRFPPSNWGQTPGMFVKLWEPGVSSLASGTEVRWPQLSVRADTFEFDGWERSATLISNSQSVVAPLTRVASHAREMWEANAYVHQYEMHGFERDELSQAFEDMDQMVYNYTQI